MDIRRRDIALQDATIMLRTGETISEFQRSLSNAIEPLVRAAFLAGVEEHSYWYTEEILADLVVCYVRRSQEPAFTAYFGLPWTRTETGAFAFGTFTEVVRRVSYERSANPTVAIPVPPPPPEEQAENALNRRDYSSFAVPFYAGASGEAVVVNEVGTFDAERSMFPHHRGAVADPYEDASVDINALRVALASEGDWRRFGNQAATAERRARTHLEGHADRLIKAAGESPSAPVARLAEDLRTIRAGGRRIVAERLRAEGALVG